MEAVSPILYLKGRKNAVEAEGMARAHLKDAAALCDCLSELEERVGVKGFLYGCLTHFVANEIQNISQMIVQLGPDS